MFGGFAHSLHGRDVVSTENGEASAVDDQAKHRDEDRLVESDRNG